MDLELRDKTAIVTGGSRGIGKEIARELAREGVDVALVARTREPLDATSRELSQETGRRVLSIVADTGKDEDVRNMVREVVQTFGRVDILVNCAAQPGGQAPPPKLAEITDDHFWPDVNVKVMGYLRCAREVAPHMRQRGWGRIINISGMAARQTGTIIGSMRNVAVVALTKNLAEELSPNGINVTVVHPSLVRTEKTPGAIAAQAKRQDVSPEEVERRIAEGNLIRRMIDTRDIAHIVAFLASPKSAAITGDVIAAGGGTPRSIHY